MESTEYMNSQIHENTCNVNTRTWKLVDFRSSLKIVKIEVKNKKERKRKLSIPVKCVERFFTAFDTALIRTFVCVNSDMNL